MQSEQQVRRSEYRRLTASEVGRCVRRFRKQAGLKQLTLAFEARVHERTVQRIERGEKVDDESLRMVARALRLDEKVYLEPQYVPTVEELELEAKKAFAEFTVMEAHGLTTLNDCAAVLTTHVFCFVDHLVSEGLADQLAQFKDLLTDWGDLWGDLSHVDRLEACRSVLALSERIRAEGYRTLFGVYTTQDRWRFRVAVLVFVQADDGRTPNVTQLIVPRTLQGLERRGPVAMMSLPHEERVAPPTTNK